MLSFLDHVYVLTRRDTVNERMRRYFVELFQERVTFFEVEGSQKKSNEGHVEASLWKILHHAEVDDTARDITNNHYQMIRRAYEEGGKYVLFLEDDALFDSMSSEKEKRMETWMNQRQDKWDILYLGYCLWPHFWSLFASRDIVRVFRPLTAHAYILHRQSMQRILMHLEDEKQRNDHIDNILPRIRGIRTFAMFPMMSFQSRDPALFTKACDHLGLSISFRRVCRTIELVSICVPFLLIFVILVWILWKK